MTRRFEQQAAEPLPGVPGVVRWGRAAEAAGSPEPQGWAVSNNGRLVLVDPLPLPEGGLGADLGKPEAILLTGPERQRTAFRLRRELGADVFAPAELEGLEEEPDLLYEAGDALPGGLVSFHAPGPRPQTQVLWRTSGPRGVVFLSGLLVHQGGGILRLADGLQEPERARLSVGRILAGIPADILCFLWGPPLVGDGSKALRRLFDSLPEPAQPVV